MGLFAQTALSVGGVAAWLVVGLIAGWLANYMMQGGRFGMIGDIVIGLVGAVVGGLVFSQLVAGDVGFQGSIAVAFVGACLFIAIVRVVGNWGMEP